MATQPAAIPPSPFGLRRAKPHEIWHRLSGRQMGYVGHSVDSNVNYERSNNSRVYGANPSANADFDLAYNHITTFDQGSMGGAYTVRAGDTLQSIAANLWGDASLWWKIAEANGLSGQSALSEGQSLLIPVGVQRNENNASTFQPYDPLEVLGNTSPTSPKPPKAGGCGVMGQVILVVIAVVVSIFTAGAALAAMGALTAGGGIMGGVTAIMAGGAGVIGVGGMSITGTMMAASAIGGAVGSIVSQGVGVATGIQDKFSWNAVAMAGISAGIGAGVAKIPGLSGGTTTAIRSLQAGARGALGSALAQGIGDAIGVHDKFSESVTQTLLVLDCARPFREGSPLPGPRRFHDAQY